ncbi:MAG: multidrug effflux MFS transporter, partial [Microbacteriaceae bacterium]|nr:multidrug effflux MFS transporter [Microbacteriaceae bacterium]
MSIVLNSPESRIEPAVTTTPTPTARATAPGSASAAAPATSPTARRLALGAAIIAPLVLVSAMPPLGTAAYLPGLPIAADEFGVATSAVQLTLTVYIIGMALGQLIIGPLSDRLGRRRPLLIGIAAFVALSAAVAFAPTLEIMLALRLLQGVAASSGMVLGRAIVNDMARGDRAAQVMNVITAAGLLVPALAPLLGSAVLAFAPWRTIFLVLAGLGALVGVWVIAKVPETHPKHRSIEPADPAAAAGGPGGPGRKGAGAPDAVRFVLYTAAVALSFAAMYAMISAGPFVFQQVHGFSPAGYAWTMAGLSGTMAAVGIAGSRLVGRPTRFGTLTAPRAVTFGLVWTAVGALVVLAAVLAEAPVALLIAALAVTAAPIALVSGSATAMAMGSSPLPGGTTSGIVGTTQAALGAATPPLVGILGASALPMALTLVIAAALAAL